MNQKKKTPSSSYIHHFLGQEAAVFSKLQVHIEQQHWQNRTILHQVLHLPFCETCQYRQHVHYMASHRPCHVVDV